MSDDTIEEIRARIAKLRARETALIQGRAERRRKIDTRIKILLGANLIAQARGEGADAAEARRVYGRAFVQLRADGRNRKFIDKSLADWLSDGCGISLDEPARRTGRPTRRAARASVQNPVVARRTGRVTARTIHRPTGRNLERRLMGSSSDDSMSMAELTEEIHRLQTEHDRIQEILVNPVEIAKRRARRGVGLGRWAETLVLTAAQMDSARLLTDKVDRWLYLDYVLRADGWQHDPKSGDAGTWRGPRPPPEVK